MKVTAVIATAAVVTAGLIETSFRLRAEPSDKMAGKLVWMAAAKQCPNKPEALRKATLDAFTYSLTDPISMPPWHVLIFSQRTTLTPKTGKNVIAQGFCDEIIKG